MKPAVKQDFDLPKVKPVEVDDDRLSGLISQNHSKHIVNDSSAPGMNETEREGTDCDINTSRRSIK